MEKENGGITTIRMLGPRRKDKEARITATTLEMMLQEARTKGQAAKDRPGRKETVEDLESCFQERH